MNKNYKLKRRTRDDIKYELENSDNNIEYLLSKIIYHAIQVGKTQAGTNIVDSQKLLSENCEIIDNLREDIIAEIIDFVKFCKEV